MATSTVESLIAELFENPQRFDEAGRAYDLLQAYFAGASLDTLRPLLRSNDVWTQRSASFVTSELGGQAKPLLDDVIPLLDSPDRHVQCYAMEVVTVCGEGERAETFGRVVKKLDSEDGAVLWRAIDLLARADLQQLQAAAKFLGRQPGHEKHLRGLQAVVAAEHGTNDQINELFEGDSDLVLQRYSAVARKRFEYRKRIGAP